MDNESPTPNLLNKKSGDLTVADNLKLMVIAPAIMVGGMIAIGSVAGVVGAIGRKFRRTPKPVDTTPVVEPEVKK